MFFRLLSRLIESLVVLIAGIIVAIVTAEVTLRYLFSHSMIFTEELSRYLMVWIVFLGSALAIRDGSHIHIQILVKRLSPRMQQIVKLTAYALIIAFLVFITASKSFRLREIFSSLSSFSLHCADSNNN